MAFQFSEKNTETPDLTNQRFAFIVYSLSFIVYRFAFRVNLRYLRDMKLACLSAVASAKAEGMGHGTRRLSVCIGNFAKRRHISRMVAKGGGRISEGWGRRRNEIYNLILCVL